ncbi:winged helix-turn-helix domain-containing protein [Aeromonas cavernicola]|uniref:OmpR/PhoB-type domain-containing protein n=1 Tax=Aeromonas cavernicola TaxID=1006623 RepID=A0A2H9U8M0_9GAMM|nr:winged helix-turn-helix domain-containing protein [Aeromonas cavernicola]PJG60352.1 hypothetical protein CUC53_02280 [Aeromonas cavernicola]
MFSLNPETGDVTYQGTIVGQLNASESLVLQCLIDHPGELITKEALLEIGWPGKVVLPNSLTVAIKNIRKILLAVATDDFIETRHRKGYIFHAIQPLDTPEGSLALTSYPTAANGILPLTVNDTPDADGVPSSLIKRASVVLIELFFYSVIILLSLWSLFLFTLDTPLFCQEINQAIFCGYSELDRHELDHLEETSSNDEGVYLYGYDKDIDNLQILKMD